MSRDLTALIGSRICHDLISPLGAIGNGVELLSMSGLVEGPEMSLISQSVENANARIKFFRIAFGAARVDQHIGRPEVTSVLKDISQGGRINFDWQPQNEQPRQEVKLSFLLMQCFESAMPRGGRITVSTVGEQWAITGEAEVLNIKPNLWEILSVDSSDTDLSAAEVHFALAPIAAKAAGRRLKLESSTNTARVRF